MVTAVIVNKPSNRREDFRVRGEYRMSVRLLKCPGIRHPARQRVECRSSDVSPRGVRCAIVNAFDEGEASEHTFDSLVIGSVLRLRIALNHPRRSFVHTGTVRWVERLADSPVMLLGIEFTHSPSHVLRAWDRIFERYLAAGVPVPFI